MEIYRTSLLIPFFKEVKKGGSKDQFSDSDITADGVREVRVAAKLDTPKGLETHVANLKKSRKALEDMQMKHASHMSAGLFGHINTLRLQLDSQIIVLDKSMEEKLAQGLWVVPRFLDTLRQLGYGFTDEEILIAREDLIEAEKQVASLQEAYAVLEQEQHGDAQQILQQKMDLLGVELHSAKQAFAEMKRKSKGITWADRKTSFSNRLFGRAQGEEESDEVEIEMSSSHAEKPLLNSSLMRSSSERSMNTEDGSSGECEEIPKHKTFAGQAASAFSSLYRSTIGRIRGGYDKLEGDGHDADASVNMTDNPLYDALVEVEELKEAYKQIDQERRDFDSSEHTTDGITLETLGIKLKDTGAMIKQLDQDFDLSSLTQPRGPQV